MDGYGLAVKVGKFVMNKYCRAQRSHRPSEAKDCPYCRLCPHGCTEYMTCEECHKDQSWRDAPITKAEMRQVLGYLKSVGVGPFYLQRRPKKKRFPGCGVPLIPLAVLKLKELIDQLPE